MAMLSYFRPFPSSRAPVWFPGLRDPGHGTRLCNQVRPSNATSLGEDSNQQLVQVFFEISLLISTSRCDVTNKYSQFFNYKIVRILTRQFCLGVPQ